MSIHASCATCRSSWRVKRSSRNRLKFRDPSPLLQVVGPAHFLRHALLCEVRAGPPCLPSIREGNEFIVRKNDRFFRSILFDDLRMQLWFHGPLSTISFAPMQDSVNDNFIGLDFKENLVIAHAQSIAGLEL